MSQVDKNIDQRIGYSVKRLQQALRTAADEVLRPLGLTMPQYAALSALAAEPGLSNSELARRCFVTRQTMNDLLAGLRRAALVNRVAHPRDGRVRQIELSSTAEDVLRRADRAVAAVEQRMTRAVAASARLQLQELLAACIDNLERD